MENLALIVGIAAVALAAFWLIKKLLSLAFWTALLGLGAWLWYFKIR